MVEKIINRRLSVNALSNQKVDFAMTPAAEFAKVFFVKVVFICVYMMYMEFFGGRLANLASMLQFSCANKKVTPLFFSCSIQKMIFSLKRELAFFRTKGTLFFSENPCCVFAFAYATDFHKSRLFSANHGAIFRSFNSIISRVVRTPATFANFNNFRFFSHMEQLYAN